MRKLHNRLLSPMERTAQHRTSTVTRLGRRLFRPTKLDRVLDLQVEPLESRQLLATFTVTDLGDGAVAAAGDQPGTLRQAVFDANQNTGADTIEFDLPGLIALTDGAIQITDDLTINGFGENLLTISGQGDSRIFDLNNTSANINDITIVDGFDFYNGGAINTTDGDLTLTDVTISGSTALGKGGAVYASYNSALSLSRTSVVGNSAQAGGGVYGFSVEVADSLILNNTAETFGGALNAKIGLVLSDSSVIGNESSGGGGIFASGELQISGSTVQGNRAVDGGGIAAGGSLVALTIDNSEISGNSASSSSGGLFLYVAQGQATITATTISGNVSEGKGAGINVYVRDSQVTIQDSTISGNSTIANGVVRHRGGGINFESSDDDYADSSTLRVINTQLSGNEANFGGGVAAELNNNDQLIIQQSSISGNKAEFGGAVYLKSNGGSVNITTTNFTANSAQGFGGAIYGRIENASILIEDVHILANTAGLSGGGVSLFVGDGTNATIRQSTFSGNRAIDDRGGGLFAPIIGGNGLLLVEDSEFVINQAGDEGGAIYAEISSYDRLEINNTTISNNRADIGGGVALRVASYGRVEVRSSTISGNRANSGTGGGLHAELQYDGLMEIDGSQFTGNESYTWGGGIYTRLIGATVKISNTQVLVNRAVNGGGGIAFKSFDSTMIVRSSTISGNSVTDTFQGDGGGIYADLYYYSSLQVESSTISGNEAANGGGIYFDHDYSYVSVRSSTVSGNSARYNAGGIGSRFTRYSSRVGIYYSTIYGNTAGSEGGGTRVRGQSLDVMHSIIAGNRSYGDVPRDMDDDNLRIITHSLIGVNPGGISASDGNLFGTLENPLDPRLAPLADNGGPTPTHALLDDSPAIDAGDPAITPESAIEFDQRGPGFARVLNGVIDIGAFEAGSHVDFVVVDRRADQSFQHENDGTLVESASLDASNRNAVGIASTGSRTWVMDRNDNVYVYDEDGSLLGIWEPGEIRSAEGITTNGTDIWIVDRVRDRVYFYENAAQTLAGEVTATSSFALDSGNRTPMGITYGIVDGVERLWVVDDRGATERVFRYQIDGTLDGSWEFDVGVNSQPRGIAVDPSSASDVLIVDRRSDVVSRFDGAASTTSGTEESDATIALDPSATDTQGLTRPVSVAQQNRAAPILKAPSFTPPPSPPPRSSRQPTAAYVYRSFQPTGTDAIGLRFSFSDGSTWFGNRIELKQASIPR